MAVNLVSLVDAASMLGVSAERVRQLVVAGDLPGVRFGNAWAVPRSSVAARGSSKHRRGRPLGARRAWQSIISGEVELDDVGRYRNRGVAFRYEMSRSDVAYLSRREAVLVSGVDAANGFGEPLSGAGPGGVLYVPDSLHDHLGSEVALVEDPLGELVVRVVADALWDLVSGASKPLGDGRRLAPRAAVALDLMDSAEPRCWVAAEHLIGTRV